MHHCWLDGQVLLSASPCNTRNYKIKAPRRLEQIHILALVCEIEGKKQGRRWRQNNQACGSHSPWEELEETMRPGGGMTVISTISRVQLQLQEAWPRSGPAEQSVPVPSCGSTSPQTGTTRGVPTNTVWRFSHRVRTMWGRFTVPALGFSFFFFLWMGGLTQRGGEEDVYIS